MGACSNTFEFFQGQDRNRPSNSIRAIDIAQLNPVHKCGVKSLQVGDEGNDPMIHVSANRVVLFLTTLLLLMLILLLQNASFSEKTS